MASCSVAAGGLAEKVASNVADQPVFNRRTVKFPCVGQKSLSPPQSQRPVALKGLGMLCFLL